VIYLNEEEEFGTKERKEGTKEGRKKKDAKCTGLYRISIFSALILWT
jgi:hypothetical protein